MFRSSGTGRSPCCPSLNVSNAWWDVAESDHPRPQAPADKRTRPGVISRGVAFGRPANAGCVVVAGWGCNGFRIGKIIEMVMISSALRKGKNTPPCHL